MKHKILNFMMALLIFVSCNEPLQDAIQASAEDQQKDGKPTPVELSVEELNLVEQLSKGTPKISIDSAKSIAMQLWGTDETAPAPKQLMSSVFCNKRLVTNGLSKSSYEEEDTAFYLFNSPDDNGFAIIAADLRVPNQVLAFSDNGNFDENTDNPGMEFFLDLAKDYVAYCIEKAEAEKDSLAESAFRKLGINQDTESQEKKLSKYSIEYHKCTVVVPAKYTVVNYGKVGPLLKTEWGQGKPFNNKCGGSDAGCAPIAVAQLMAYWRYPNVLNGYKLDWNVIHNPNASNYDDQVSSLVYAIRRGLGTNGTSTDAHRPLKYLRNVGLSTQNQYYDYKYYKVTDALDKGMPVYMRGNKDKKHGDGHAWIADGYLKRKVTQEEVVKYLIFEHFDDGTVTSRYENIPSTSTSNYELLYINWGWLSHGNGYYNKDVFDTYKRFKETPKGDFFISPEKQIGRMYYNTNIEIITDIKPRY